MDNQHEAVIHARQDLAQRLGVSENDVNMISVKQVDFPDAALGAPGEDEMSAQVITPGWRIQLKAQGESYEYRSSGKQLRLYNFKGNNYRI